MAAMSKAERALRAIPAPIRSAVIEVAAPVRKRAALARPTPRWITLFVTNYCNARCEHCFYWRELNNRAPEMDAIQLSKLLHSLDGDVNTLRLSGGEPFLRKDLEEIILAADATGRIRKISIPTHGMQRDTVSRLRALVPRLRNSHLNISVSLDGLAERHDANRKIRDGFNIAIANLREMVEIAASSPLFSPSVAIALTRGLCIAEEGRRPELLDLIGFLRDEVGLSDIGFDHIRAAETDVIGLAPKWCSGFAPPPEAEAAPEVKNKRHDDVQLSAEERRAVNDMLRDEMAGRAGRLTEMRMDVQQEIFERRARVVDCLAGFIDCVVYPTGDVAVCEFSKSFANLADYEYDLPALLRDAAADQARAATRKCACTHPCHLSDSLAYDAEFLHRFLAAP